METILGQEQAVGVLEAQLASGRVHHALIFHGPAGVGKFTTAVELARVLLCHEPMRELTGRVTACGSCRSCRLLAGQGPEVEEAEQVLRAGGAHPDVHVVAKELALYHEQKQIRERKLTQIPMEILRAELVEPATRAAVLGHGKVFIVDEAELISAQAQNVLLKTLEEPPAGTTIVLVTSSEDRLLPTIRSRCQRVAFRPLADEVVGRWVARHHGGLSQTEQAAVAGGSIGRAALAVSYGLGEWASLVEEELAEMEAGRPTGRLGAEMARCIDDFAQAWVKRHANASKEAANRLGAEQMFSVLAEQARQRLHAQAGGDAEVWADAIEAMEQGQAMLSSNVNLSLVCDDVAVRVAEVVGRG